MADTEKTDTELLIEIFQNKGAARRARKAHKNGHYVEKAIENSRKRIAEMDLLVQEQIEKEEKE